MIGFLRGQLLLTELDWLILDVNGVGYEVKTPSGVAGRLDKAPQGEVSIWIHTSVREDALDLYGFASRDDRQLFRLLTSVNRVGPSLGLAILSTLRPHEVVDAVHGERVSTFKQVSGIGKKTAQRLILELQNKLDDLVIDRPTSSSPAALDQPEQLQSALLNLGVDSTTIDQVIDQLAGDVDGDEPTEALVRKALQLIN